MQKPINPFIYALYMLVLKHNMTPEEVYWACKGKSKKNLSWIIHDVGLFAEETMTNSTELMRRWLYRALAGAGLTNEQSPIYPLAELVGGHGGQGVYFMPSTLADFIAKYATNNIKLTWLDRLKRQLR